MFLVGTGVPGIGKKGRWIGDASFLKTPKWPPKDLPLAGSTASSDLSGALPTLELPINWGHIYIKDVLRGREA